MKPDFTPSYIPQIYLDIKLPIGRAAGLIYPSQQKDGSWTAIVGTIPVVKDIYREVSFCLRPTCDYYFSDPATKTVGMPNPLGFKYYSTPSTAPKVFSSPSGSGYLIGVNLGFREGKLKCGLKVSYLPAKGGKISATTGWKDICYYRLLKPNSWFVREAGPPTKGGYWADQPHTNIQEIIGTVSVNFPKVFAPFTKVLYGGGGPVISTPFAKASPVLFPPFLPNYFPGVPTFISLQDIVKHRDWLGKQPFNYWLTGASTPNYVQAPIYFFISDVLVYPKYMGLLDYFYNLALDGADGYGMYLLSQYSQDRPLEPNRYDYGQLFLTTNNPYWPDQFVSPPMPDQDLTGGWYSKILPANIAERGVDIGMGCIVHNLHAWLNN